jgi:hypothetical protein
VSMARGLRASWTSGETSPPSPLGQVTPATRLSHDAGRPLSPSTHGHRISLCSAEVRSVIAPVVQDVGDSSCLPPFDSGVLLYPKAGRVFKRPQHSCMMSRGVCLILIKMLVADHDC